MKLFLIILFAFSLKAIHCRKPYTVRLPISGPITGPYFPMGPICIDVMEHGLRLINNRTDILPNYHLIMDFWDDQCLGETGVAKIMPYFQNQNHVRGDLVMPREDANITDFFTPPLLVGSICSGVCHYVAPIAKNFKYVEVYFLLTFQ